MAKITIEELYRGEKYDIMSAVTAKSLQLGIDERTEEGRTWIEMELVRQTLIASEQMKKNGDCIAEGELGMRPPFHYTEEELQVLDAIRSMYPKASDKVIRMVFKDMKRGYKPQTELELIDWMDKLIASYALGEALGLTGDCDEIN